MNTSWSGVFPAVTTKFHADGSLDLPSLERHIAILLGEGAHGIVVLGSLGENGSLTSAEKMEVLRCAVRIVGHAVPVLAGVAETTTAGACAFVQNASAADVDGFMALPPMQYVSDRRETLIHLRAVARASERPIMLYNNPVAYRVDITPEMFAELASEPTIVALKESSDDVRRITDIVSHCGDRYRIFIGVDDLALEAFLLGAVGWVAGLVGAFPSETVALYRLAAAGRYDEARALYRWFTPLLHLDTSIKFVQYIKFAEALTGLGSEHVRPPRLSLEGRERQEVESIVRRAIQTRPTLPPS